MKKNKKIRTVQVKKKLSGERVPSLEQQRQKPNCSEQMKGKEVAPRERKLLFQEQAKEVKSTELG